MAASPMEIIRPFPDRRRAEGKRFDHCFTRYSAWWREPTRTGKCMNSFAFIASA